MLACAAKRWEPAQTSFARSALFCPPRNSTTSRVTHGTATKCRIHQLRPVGSTALSGNSVPEDCPPNALSEVSAVLREQMPDSLVGVDPRGLPREPTRSCLLVASSRQSMCGEAGPKRTKYPTLLIRRRAVVARGAPRRNALIGRCHTLHRTRQTSQPGSGDALHEFSACDDYQKRSGSQRHHTHRGMRLASSLNRPQELRFSRLASPQSASVISSGHGQHSILYGQ